MFFSIPSTVRRRNTHTIKMLYFSDSSAVVFKSLFSLAIDLLPGQWELVAEHQDSDLTLVNTDTQDGRLLMELNRHDPSYVAHGHRASESFALAVNKPLISTDVIDLLTDHVERKRALTMPEPRYLGLTRWLSFHETEGFSQLDKLAITIARFQPGYTELKEKLSMDDATLRMLILRLNDMGCLKCIPADERGYREDLVDRRMASEAQRLPERRSKALPVRSLHLA